MLLTKEFSEQMWTQYCAAMRTRPNSKYWYLKEHEQEYRDWIATFIGYGNPCYGKNV